MSTKPRKSVNTGITEQMEIKLDPVKFKRRDQHIQIRGDTIVDLDEDAIPTFLENLRKQIQDKADVYSPAEKVIEVLSSPELERNKPGKEGQGSGAPKRDPQTGNLIAKPFNIKTQRRINRIFNEIEPKLDKMGTDRTKHKSMTIKLKPADVVYMANRMLTYFDEFSSIQPYVPDAYDFFYDLKAEANRIIESE